MAQLVVSAVGAGVGFMVGGPAGAKVGWIAGALLGAYAFAETQRQEGPRLNDLKITGTDYGEPLPWVQGSPRIAGQIAWASERREHKHTESQGKGGGAESTSYTYTCDLMILLSENPIAGVGRVWANSELVYGNGETKDGFWREMRVYTGTADQMPDPLYEAAVGVGNAPAYRGHGYVVIENLDLGGSGNIPNLTFELGEAVDSENVTCVAVIDETEDSQTQASINAAWESFSAQFPNRKLYLIVPNIKTANPDPGVGNEGVVYLPDGRGSNFIGPFFVRRDGGNPDDADDWYEICGLDSLSNNSSIALFIDNSGSMYTGTVQASHDLFLGRLAARGISTVQVTGSDEDYITPFNRFIDIPGGNSVVSKDLEGVASSLMFRAGYAAADFDAVALRGLEKPLRALTLSQTANTRSALEVLQKAWFFECSATDKLALRPRAVAPVARIPFADLGFGNDSGGAEEPLALKIGNDLEQPAQLALTYANMTADFNADTQFSDRLVTGQASTETLQVPLGMLPAEAKAVVDALLFDMAASMHSTTLSLPLRYAFLEPGDVIEAVALDGRVLRLRITTRKDQQMFLELECVLDDVGALESAAITDEGYVSVTEPTRVPGTVWEAMDIPILRDADNASGFYLAAAPESINFATDQWRGAVATASWDGVDYMHLQTLLDAAVLGQCTTVLPAWSGGAVFDEACTLTVRVWGQLASSTREAMLLDDTVNALLVGDEVVRFRHAELLASDVPANVYTYRLSSLLRGQRGTEWAMAGHVANERCVLLNTRLRRQPTQTNEVNVPMQLKVLTSGKLLSSVEPRTFTDTRVALKPFSPAGLRGLVDAAGVHLSWQRRTRLAYRYGGIAPVVPLGEAAESYRVQVRQGGVLLRTAVVTTAAFLYTPAMRAADGLAGGELLRFAVAQISAAAGAGYESTIERVCT
ncbi:MAG: phage tail protein [Comamonas sp.]|uniref:phage tail protein n=1 Tax=Comamonas sp. TaxID=34028 RepID=UPI00264763A1|nr:phage tail protein [Comamonas sp.]MDN5506392.1 phage tail protein [Comamonas sp.]MDN5536959.1 phage tail protein [Comamonas sp.]